MDYKSNIKLAIKYLSVVLLVSFGVITVFSSDLIFDPQIKKIEFLSKNIFLDDNKLNTNYLIYTSNSDLSKYNLGGNCNIKTKFIGKNNSKYMFKIKYLDKECYNPTLFLETKEKIKLKKSFIGFNLFDKSKLFDLYVDNNNLNLNKINKNISKNIFKLTEEIQKFKNKDFEYLKAKRKLDEFKYHLNFLKIILDNRNKKYLKPVEGYNISIEKNKIPNAGRPYRSSYTDGIHHGWDIMAPLYTPVRALDYGKIVKIVRNFKFSDLNRIRKGSNLTYVDKIKNLDILRGNQVWLKTSKGDLVFYSHLSSIPENLNVGDIVFRDTNLGKVGTSGVPDRSYTNYHLHFPIMKNPYVKSKVGKYTLMDYMKWDWYFKGKSLDYVSINSSKIFN